MVRRVLGPEGHVQEEGLARAGRLLVADEADRLVHDVGREVVVGRVGRLDVVVVEHQFRMPLVGLALQEAEVAVEAALQRPLVVGAGGRRVLHGGEVPLAHGEGGIALVAQHLGHGGGVVGGHS